MALIAVSELKYSIAAFAAMTLLVWVGFAPIIQFSSRRIAGRYRDWLEIGAYSLVFTVLYLAFCAFFLLLMPMAVRSRIAIVLYSLPLLVGGAALLKIGNAVLTNLKASSAIVAGGAGLFGLLLLVLAALHYPLPESLRDGAYVNKEHVSAVRIQFFTGDMPADNVVPFVAEEYLAHGISFRENAPILPGQQVTNRPILVSLVTLPIRLAMGKAELITSLPKFEYVATQWPDFRLLVRDTKAFSIFLGVGVFLNSALLIGAGLLLSQRHTGAHPAAMLVALFATSPYLIFQTVFTWPKALAGFFILLAAFVYFAHRRAGLAGFLVGLAYLSHPYAIAYALVAGVLLLLLPGTWRERIVRASAFAGGFVMPVAPWFVWAKYVLAIPSDLVEQNFVIHGMKAYAFFSTRVANLLNTILPTHLMSYDGDFAAAYVRSGLNLSGALGGLMVVWLLLQRSGMGRVRKQLQGSAGQMVMADVSLNGELTFCTLSALLLLVVFSSPAIPLVHGWQPLAALLLVLCVNRAEMGAGFGVVLVWLQVAINLMLCIYYVGVKSGQIAF